jgi:hypothetical protein
MAAAAGALSFGGVDPFSSRHDYRLVCFNGCEQSFGRPLTELPGGRPTVTSLICGYNATMRHTLRLHPDSFCAAVTRIEVDVVRPRFAALVLTYVVMGEIGDLAMPPAAAATRTGDLWQHTCFEVFVRCSLEDGYYELNFAPSTQWAAYRFSSYRRGMCIASEIGAPRIAVQASPERFVLRASLDIDGMSPPPPVGERDGRAATLHLGLSAVIEETGGRQSLWALAHPPGKPDFHHSDCFALEVA